MGSAPSRSHSVRRMQLEDIDLSDVEGFWTEPIAVRDAAFETLRREDPIRYFAEHDTEFLPAGPGYYALTRHADIVEAMLATEAGRALMVEGMIEEGPLTADQAVCLLDNLDLETLVVLLNDMDEEPPPEVVVSLLLLLDTCDLGDLFAE